MKPKEKIRTALVFRTAGAFVAWIIGSGFATGQEILQFFSSYGWKSYAGIALTLAEFIFFGVLLVSAGYEHSREEPFPQFSYFCGKVVGGFYTWLTPLLLVCMISVLLSGAGATLAESFGIPAALGSSLLAIAVLGVYLAGFSGLLRIVSLTGPLIILFSLLVGTLTVIRDAGAFGEIAGWECALAAKRTSPHVLLSALLYFSSNFFCGSTYFIRVGASCPGKREARLGAALGALALILVILLMNTAILLNAGATAALNIPTLYMAQKISPVLGYLFTGILLLGIFSSCSAMLWTVGDRLGSVFSGGRAKIATICVVLIALVLGLFSFSELMSVLYPAIGYIGLLYFLLMCIRTMRDRYNRRHFSSPGGQT